MHEEGNNHFGLGDILHDRRLPSTLASEELMTPAQLNNHSAATARQLQAMFYGIPTTGDQRLPMNIYLHKEQTQEVESTVAFDADSFLGFIPTLAAAKSGLSYQPAPQTQ